MGVKCFNLFRIHLLI